MRQYGQFGQGENIAVGRDGRALPSGVIATFASACANGNSTGNVSVDASEAGGGDASETDFVAAEGLAASANCLA